MGQEFKQDIAGAHQSLSRRAFLKGSGVGAATTVMLDKTLPEFLDSEAQAAEQKTVGPGAAVITLIVNGKPCTLAVAPNTTLAEALRDRLDLTGTKIGCDRGACSACTIWLDGAPVASCMLLALDVGSRKVTTIEGLANGDNLHPVQSAFVAHDAIQCGFCTPGMVMSCAALVEANPNPTQDDVKAAIGGHFCRCGTYPHVVAATLDAARSRKA